MSNNRLKNDNKAKELIDEILSDFNKYGKDLRKVKIIDGDGSKISINSIEVGYNYTLAYVFGKFHTINRNLMSGNRENWDRRIKIVNVP